MGRTEVQDRIVEHHARVLASRLPRGRFVPQANRDDIGKSLDDTATNIRPDQVVPQIGRQRLELFQRKTNRVLFAVDRFLTLSLPTRGGEIPAPFIQELMQQAAQSFPRRAATEQSFVPTQFPKVSDRQRIARSQAQRITKEGETLQHQIGIVDQPRQALPGKFNPCVSR